MTARGDRVVLVSTSDRYTSLKKGTRGTVAHVDGLGTAHVNWDDGRRLGLVPDEDHWLVLEPTVVDAEGRTSCCSAMTTFVEGVECCKVCYEAVER
jgi:hypothetical protein